MTVKPTDILKEEHKSALQKLDALEDLIGNLNQKERISVELKELTSFFNTDFWMHFDKEEKALFPEFDNFMPRGSGPLAVMIEEHEVLRKIHTVMQEAVTRYFNNSNDADTRHTITENGTHFIDFLRNHISKEDSILFMMADMHLNQGQVKRVLELFEKIEASGVKTPQTEEE